MACRPIYGRATLRSHTFIKCSHSRGRAQKMKVFAIARVTVFAAPFTNIDYCRQFTPLGEGMRLKYITTQAKMNSRMRSFCMTNDKWLDIVIRKYHAFVITAESAREYAANKYAWDAPLKISQKMRPNLLFYLANTFRPQSSCPFAEWAHRRHHFLIKLGDFFKAFFNIIIRVLIYFTKSI